MKKVSSVVFFVLFTMILMASTSHAVTFYEKEGFKYKLNGDWQIQFRQDPGADQDADIEYDDLEIKNSVSYKVNDDVTVFGQLDFGFKNAAEKPDDDENPHLEEAYVGATYKNYSLAIGKSDSAADEFGIEGSIEGIVAEDAFDELGATSGDDLIRFDAEFENIRLVAAHEVEGESEKSDGNGTFTDVFVGVELGKFELGAAYQTFEDFEATDSVDIYGASLSYDAGFATFAADYSKAEDNVTPANDQSIWNLYTWVPVKENAEVRAGYVTQDFDSAAIEDIKGWYATAIYYLPPHEKVSVFAEIADDDQTDSDMGFLAGARIKF